MSIIRNNFILVTDVKKAFLDLLGFKFVVTLMLFGVFSLFYAQKINLTTADLGRHIKNGEVTLKTFKPVSTNYYSYTDPENFVVNHHWGAGVIFYVIYKYLGFNGLSLFFVLVNTLAIFFFFKTSSQKIDPFIILLVIFALVPLIASRVEIRPEVFSYFFLGVYFYFLLKIQHSVCGFSLQNVWPPFLLLFISQIVWVNVHIFFVMGLFLVGAFVLDSLINFENLHKFKLFGVLFILLALASLINPYEITGLLEPFHIFKEYGYMIVENQSVLFMQRLLPRFLYTHFELILVFTLILLLSLLFERKFRRNFIFITPVIVFGFMGFNSIRLIPIFGLFFIPFVSETLHALFGELKLQRSNFSFWENLLFGLIVGVSLVLQNFYFSPFNRNSGIGLMPKMQSSAEFFKANNLKGPIFNNYDIGGYLIFNLFPQEKVFVDNRPEAYSVSFFKDTYVPMQEDETVWEKTDAKYNFNVIYFYRHDYTPWAQPFLIRRLNDSSWVPVFVDDYVLILIKNVPENSDVINKYHLPKELFTVY